MFKAILQPILKSMFQDILGSDGDGGNQLRLMGDGKDHLLVERKSSVAIPSGSQWLVNDVPYVEGAATNSCLWSDNVLNNTSWLVAGGSKVQNGTVKSPDGTYDVPLLEASSLGMLYQDISVPAGTYTTSFYIYGTEQNIVATALPNNISNTANRNYVDIVVTNKWKKVVITTTFAAPGTLRVLIDTRTGNALATKPSLATCKIAITGFMVQSGSVATSDIKTTTTAVTRSAGQVASGPSFHVRTADVTKKITYSVPSTIYNSPSKTFTNKYFLIVLGQSNGFYQDTLDRTADFISPRVKQFGRRNGYFGTTVPQVLNNMILDFDNPAHFDEILTTTTNSPTAYGPDDTSYAAWFASQYAETKDLEIMVFTENRGGTGFTTDAFGADWKVTTGTLYQQMMARIDAYLLLEPTAKCIGVLPSLQEMDIASGMAWNTYKGHYLNLMNDIRGKSWALNSTIPIIHVPFCRTWALGDPTLKATYYSGLQNLGSELSNYAFVDTSGSQFTSNGEVIAGSTDLTHYSKAAGKLIALAIFAFFSMMMSAFSSAIYYQNPPINSVAPAVSGSNARGGTLTSADGSWLNPPITSITYQWRRNGSNISGAVNNNYTLTISDIATSINCAVTASNGAGSKTVLSNSISVVDIPPVNLTVPVLAGLGKVGVAVTTNNGTWLNNPVSYSYQWKKNGVNISGATSSNYTPISGDLGATLTCTVTAINTGGSSSVTTLLGVVVIL